MSKPSLEQLQHQFIRGIYQPQPDSQNFVDPGSLTAQEQLAIYRGSVLGGLVTALGDIYPAIKRSVGERFFDAMALRYAKVHPSRSASLDDYGEEFPQFLGEFDALDDYPYLVDLARLEWHWHLAFHCSNPNAFDPAQLSSISEADQSRIRFGLQSSLFLLNSDFPLLAIWQLNQDDTQAPEIDWEQKSKLAVWRDGLVTRISELSDAEYQLLLAIKKQESLGTIFTHLGSIVSVELINEALARFVQRSWIASVELGPEESSRTN